MNRIIAILLASLVAIPVMAAKKKPVNNWKEDHTVRISWDKSSFQEITESYVSNKGYIERDLFYPRIKRLSDGALLLSYSNHHYGWDIYASRSEDNGKTWNHSYNIIHSYDTLYNHSSGKTIKDRIVFVNPDFIELQDGRIIMAFQWRFKEGYADLPVTNNNCGVMISFSEDKGKTWCEPREVYRGRCWEPAFLQLPSGEIQMYITSSQDIKDKTSFPRTMVIRSFDGGATWQGKECCGINDNEAISRSYDERFAYDGMPSGVLLDDGKGIVVPLESWHGRLVVDQTPIVVKTTMEENWRTDQQKILDLGGPDYPMKKEVNKDLQGYGPYSTKLSTGEVVILTNGTYKGEAGVWTVIGDKVADNFHFATAPFTESEYWGCIDNIDENRVIACATYKYNERGTDRAMVRAIKGRLNRAITLSKGVVPALPRVAEFDRDGSDWWFLGKKFDAQLFTNFSYNDAALSFHIYNFDSKITAFTPENSDAAAILFSRPDGKNFEVVINANGRYVVYEEERYSWHPIASGTTDKLEVVGTINKDKDTDLGYSATVDIDWSLLGGKPAKGETIKVHLRKFYKQQSTEKPLSLVEDLEGENSDYPQEWLGITLQ